jgi:hypothetical protein
MANLWIKKGNDIVECRICGLNFIPELAEDHERHQHEHRKIICGSIPFEIREFLKSFGWAVAHGEAEANVLSGKWTPEIGKRAVVFAWWTRAVSNGIPENDFESFMAAQFAFIDAKVSGDETAIEKGNHLLERWQKYGG